jgi:hypothetical protein
LLPKGGFSLAWAQYDHSPFYSFLEACGGYFYKCEDEENLGAISMRKKPKTLVLSTLLILALFFSLVPISLSDSATSPPIGINLGRLQAGSNAQLPFKNLMKMASPWMTKNVDDTGLFDNGHVIPSDSNGWPLQIPFDPDGSGATPLQKAVTAIPISDNGAGTYTLVLGGSGQIRLSGDAVGTFDAPGTYQVQVSSPTGKIQLDILQSSASNPITQIDLVRQEFISDYVGSPFHPDFIDLVDDFQAIRPMDMLRMNGNVDTTWESRRPVTFFTQATMAEAKGISWEYLVELANIARVDLWITIPHLADDNYVRELARLFRDQLDPSLKIYVEHSNEVWNGLFEQSAYASDQACAQNLQIELNLSFLTGTCTDGISDNGDRFWAAGVWHSKRSTRIFQIFEEEFGSNSDRVVNVMGGFLASTLYNEQILRAQSIPSINQHPARAEALAITTYYGGRVGEEIGDAGEIDSISVDEILNRLEDALNTQTIPLIIDNKAIADQFGVPLYAYEGNHHLVAGMAYQNNQAFVDKLIAAYRNPRMRDLTNKMFDAWFANGGELIMFFILIAPHSKFGGWGSLEYQSQDINTAPMYLGVLDALGRLSLNSSATGGKLIITDIDVKVDGKSNTNLKDNDTISTEAKPGSTLKFEIEIENRFTKSEGLDIENIKLDVSIKDIDDGDDIEDGAGEFNLKHGDSETLTIELEVPLEANEDTYDIVVIVEGEDGNGTVHEAEATIFLEVEKEKHELRILRASISPQTIRCEDHARMYIAVINTGQEDENEARLEISALATGWDVEHEFALEEGDENNRYENSFQLPLGTVAVGTYTAEVHVYYDTTKLSDTATITFSKEECMATGPSSGQDYATVEMERQRQTQAAQRSFRDTRTYDLLLASAFVTLSIVAMAGIIALMKRL